MKPSDIAICGFGRSGSTLFYNMLRHTLNGYHLYAKEFSFFEAKAVKPDSPVCTKNPVDVYKVDEIVKRYPTTVVILCVRDPRDVLCSRMRQNGPYKMSALTTMRKTNKGVVYDDNRGVLTVHKACVGALKYTPFVLRYEDLVADPEQIKEQLKQRYGFSFAGQFVDFAKQGIPSRLRAQMHNVRPVDTNSVGVWREHPERIKEQFTQFPELFDVVKFWKYEENNDWYNETQS